MFFFFPVAFLLLLCHCVQVAFDLHIPAKIYKRFYRELTNAQLHPYCHCDFRRLPPNADFDEQLPQSPPHDFPLHLLCAVGAGELQPQSVSPVDTTTAADSEATATSQPMLISTSPIATTECDSSASSLPTGSSSSSVVPPGAASISEASDTVSCGATSSTLQQLSETVPVVRKDAKQQQQAAVPPPSQHLHSDEMKVADGL